MRAVTLLLLPLFAACTLVSNAEVEGKLGGGDSDLGNGMAFQEQLPDQTSATLTEAITFTEGAVSAQDLDKSPSSGSTDTVDGSLSLNGSEGWDGNDADAYRFWVQADRGELDVRMHATWERAEVDLDFGIFGDPDGDGIYNDWFTTFGETSCRTDAKPEVCQTPPPLPPGEYYLLALAYLGSGEEPYHIELEWDP
ncbi:hypothetical protein LBMAG42_39210 [Deltaproteobacteria bacterium]|nr:hypothetical protein LBMAG42_39210 [Deltaproteobacteria bacterium]